ncbi:MAG: tetratricopeptide repeat protein, partial [Planctomycetes bacterium]|nr:tetratricopeptide repeat protein [Planctomycetota bacterium]
PLQGQDPPRQEPDPAAEAAEVAQQAHAEGWKAFEDGDSIRAEDLFRRAIDHGMPEAWRGIAEVRRREGDTGGAVEAFHELVLARPTDLRARADHASALAAIPDRRDEAVGEYRAILDSDPGDRGSRLAMAEVLSWSGRHAEAEAEFRLLLSDEPDPLLRERQLLGLADCWNWSGRRSWAADLYRQLLDGSRGHAARRGLADLELWQGRPGAAASEYDAVLRQDPDDFAARQGRADALAAQRPRLFLSAQSYFDNADWKRTKLLGGVGFQVAPDSAPDLRLRAGLEQAHYQNRAGEEADRTSLVTRLDWAVDPFTTVHAALEGSQEGDSGLRGGLGLDYRPESASSFWIGYRHDDWIDPSEPFRFDRYNGAFTPRLLTDLGRQDDSFRVGAFHQMESGWGGLVDFEGGVVQDGNSHSDSYLQLHHRFDPRPGLALLPRVFHHRKDFGLPSSLYFSPSGLESWGSGLRIEAWDGGRRREAYLDLSGFFQPSGVSSWGYQLEAGIVQRWDGGEVGLLANHLSTDERGLGARFHSTAVQAFAALVF